MVAFRSQLQEISSLLASLPTRFALPAAAGVQPSEELFKECSEQFLLLRAKVAALDETIEMINELEDSVLYSSPSPEALQFIKISSELSEDLDKSHLLIEGLNQDLKTVKRLTEQLFIFNDCIHSNLISLRTAGIIIIAQLGLLIIIGLFLLNSL